MKCVLLFGVLLFIANEVNRVQGHGRLIKPPSRASAWRYGFATEKDYNDNESYCGGLSVQHQKNGGKCGVCGDPYHMPRPRLHEHGGRYGQSVIVKTYRKGADIDIGIDLSANHQGFFEFRLCPHNFENTPETDECFDKYVLQRADNDETKYYPGAGSGIIFNSTYKLPSDLTCDQCVLQWRYIAGNNWGTCPDGTGRNGCGPQEQFRACSDIRITEDGVAEETTPSTSTLASTSTVKPRTRGTVTYRTRRPTKSTTTAPTIATSPSSTNATSATNSGTLPGENAGPYVGIIIAMATLLFALAAISAVILYFYRFHDSVKNFAFKHFHRKTDEAPSSRKQPLRPPSVSVFSQYHPELRTHDDMNKPPVPVRMHFISEPIAVSINGVSVSRQQSQHQSDA